MDTQQTYSRKANARRAAQADLGKHAIEGQDYQIQRLATGRYSYGPTTPDKGEAGPKGATPPAKPPRATVRADRQDKFGLRVGSKGSIAAAMLERGCTMADIKKATGGSRYNLLRKLSDEGHDVVRGPGGRLNLRHNGG